MISNAENQPGASADAVTMRAVEPEDENFLTAVYGTTRADELSAVPWTAEQREAFIRFQFAAQTRHYQTEYPEARHQIVLFQQQPVGRLYVDRRAHEIRILDLTILPEHGGAGIDAQLIRQLMSEAARAGLPLTIQLESFNPARELFAQLGFVPVAEFGFRTLFEWRAAAIRTD